MTHSLNANNMHRLILRCCYADGPSCYVIFDTEDEGIVVCCTGQYRAHCWVLYTAWSSSVRTSLRTGTMRPSCSMLGMLRMSSQLQI